MKIYIMLPFVNTKYISERVGTSAQLTADYRRQFKNKMVLYRTIAGCISKIIHYNPRTITYWMYTAISPETLELYEEEVNK